MLVSSDMPPGPGPSRQHLDWRLTNDEHNCVGAHCAVRLVSPSRVKAVRKTQRFDIASDLFEFEYPRLDFHSSLVRQRYLANRSK